MMLFLLRFQFLPKLELQDGQLIRVSGILTEEPQISGNRQSFKVGKIQIWTDQFPEYHYGERVEIVGKVKKLPTGYLLSYPKIKSVTGTTSITSIKGVAIKLKNNIKSLFQKYYPSPYDGLIAGIVLGDKSLIPYATWQDFKKTGTLHIMVASGMNIALFSGTVLSFLTLFFKRRIAIIFLFIVIWFYSVMTGLQPAIIRAAIMASLIYFSQLVGREAESGRVLWLTGGLMLLINPLWLLDVGFQLSFLATAGLVYLQPKLARSKFFLFKYESFSSSIGSQLSTLPVLVINFGSLNLLSPLFNLAILWTIPLILQGGILVSVLGLFWVKLGEMTAYFLYPLLFYLEKIVRLSAKLTMTQVLLPKMAWWLGFVYYLVLWLWLRRDLHGFRADSRGYPRKSA